uniref:Uncharacterized protein n=1 Tax=Plectus sambesii TaxID=2011161 RepID=A0A914V0V1_9BILA
MTNEEKQRVKAFFKDSEPNEPIDTCEKDEKCTFCLSGVYYLLAVRASYSDLNQKTWADLYNEIVRRLAGSGIPFALVRDKCKQSPDKVMNNQATSNVYNEVLRTLSCNTCMQQYLTSSTNNVNRAKRQTIGTTFTVQCYRRGQLIGDGTNYVGMCNLCWTVRQLPAQYTPRMLNEVSCTSDTTCLAGYGTCRARYRATNVMYNQVEVSINAQSGCECQVNLGSPFYAYVSA